MSTVFQKMATYPLIFRQHKVDPMGIKLKAKETWAGMEMGVCMGGVVCVGGGMTIIKIGCRKSSNN